MSINLQTKFIDHDTINQIGPITQTGESVTLDVITTATHDRPYTVALTVTPYNAGPIPHVHWSEDEWFILLQGEIDAWIPSPASNPRLTIGEVPGENGVDKIKDYHFVHMTPGQVGFLPKGYVHNYRNASPTKEPLIFLTVWSRDVEGGEPGGGIEEFFIKPDIGVFADTADAAAAIGSLYNKNPGSPEADDLQDRFRRYFDQFPDFYVGLSRNFGDYLEAGGNWNPAIAEDTQPIPAPPPTPDPFRLPAPNAASPSIDFNIPLDPAVIKRFDITVNPENSQQLLDAVRSYDQIADSQQGNLYTEFYQDPSNPQQYLLIEHWDNYSL